YEVIGSDGATLVCTPDNENGFVFQMMHGSFGTLGVLGTVTMKLVPAKRYVRMTYENYRTLDEYKEAIWHYFTRGARLRSAMGDVDFMDGIIHSPDEWVLSLGRFVDEAPYTN